MSLSDHDIDLIVSLLEEGVPKGPIARAFDLDPDVVAQAQSDLLVKEYGTDDISEAMTHLIWVGYETALHEIRHGTPASKARFIQLVLARSIGIAGKTNQDASEKVQAALASIAAHQAPKVQLAESIYDASA